MAKVDGTFYTAERMRRGTSPVSPPYTTDEGQPYPVNPPGSGASPAVEHNNTLNKQGGQEDEYYHLTEDQLEGLQELLSPPDIDRISQVGTITFDSSTAISADDWKAIFSGIELDDTPITLDPVTGTPTDYSRIDSVYYKPDGTIGYETGAEDPDGAQFPPAIPDGTLRMADILRGTDGSNVIDYIDLQLDDFVSKSDTLLQTIQSNLAITPLAGSEPNYTVLGPNGQLYRSRTDQAGLYSTLQGAGGFSKILTITLNLPTQFNYYAVIEFHGVSAAYEKGYLWVQFEVDSGGDLVTNALKCFGEFDVSKYTLVKVDADHYDLFVAHVGANDFYKFRPLANFGGSSIYTYYQLPSKVNPLPGGDDFGFTLHTTGVQSVTGDGVDNTDPDNPVLSFPTPSEIGANDDLGTDINAALTGAATPSAGNVFATMADVAGGGADTNAVHYNAADGKSATEKQQARDNIGSSDGIAQIFSDTGTANNLVRTSNLLIWEGSTNLNLTGMDEGEDGEEVCIINRTSAFTITIASDQGSTVTKRFQAFANSRYIEPKGVLIFRYDKSPGLSGRWLPLDNFMGNGSKIIKNSPGTLPALILIQPNGGVDVLRLGSDKSTIHTRFAGGSGTFNVRVTASHFLANGSSGTTGSIFYHVNGGVVPLSVRASDGTTNVFFIQSNGRVFQPTRSFNQDYSTNRSEHRLFYLVSVTTSGAINNQALTDGIFNYRFTAATSITGFANGEIGRTIDIDNATGATLTLPHEDAGSIAANRIKLIGGLPLVMPIDGKVTLKYCTGSRWELVSKNF